MDADWIVKSRAFTKTTHRDVYSAIDPTRPELAQTGKVVVITGASRGLGRQAFAASFAHAKAAGIALLGRTVDGPQGLRETERIVKEISPETKTLWLPVDVTDEDAVNDAFEQIVEKLGVPSVLVNNAGALVQLAKIGETTLHGWWRTQEINIKGTFLVSKAFINKTGATPSTPSTIINLTSGAANVNSPEWSSYSMAKQGITKFTAFLNVEYPEITSISLDPGIVATEMASTLTDLLPFMQDTPELVGGTAVWLSTGDRSYLSGRYVSVNWDVEQLEQKKEEIRGTQLLTLGLQGEFGGPDVVVEGGK